METDCTYLTYRDSKGFSNLVYDYLDNNSQLRDLYHFEPNLKGLEQAIALRKNSPVDRAALVSSLQKQYERLPEQAKVNANIASLLADNTFTICTAHQPNLLTGYLYFFYKILHAIKMASALKELHPEHHFVPVYYMGSEDNDLDELGTFRYEDKKYHWAADGQQGAVGRMKTDSLKALLNELFQTLGPPGPHLESLQTLIKESYLAHDTIAEATQYLVHQLFGQYGLVIINPDEAVFKQMFLSVMKDDLLQHTALGIVSEQSAILASHYKAQAYPRPINLFYLKEDIRERIEQEGDTWLVLNTDIRFTKEALLAELEAYPERFSPNVILRGLFQETILPNICFIGGGSELAYWLQLKTLFEHYKVFYPVVFLRQSVQIISPLAEKRIQELGISIQDAFLPAADLLQQQLSNRLQDSWKMGAEQAALNEIFEQLSQKAKATDPTLEASAQAALAKMKHQLSVLEKKIYRAEKRKHQELQQKITQLKSEIAPYGGLQERVLNFLPYYLQSGNAIFEVIQESIKPFDNLFLTIHSKMKTNEAS